MSAGLSLLSAHNSTHAARQCACTHPWADMLDCFRGDAVSHPEATQPMSSIAPFRPERFSTAASHYVRARPRYAPALIDRLARETSLGPASRVLDLGCGPGTLAIPLARLAGTVIAIDPNAEMLAAARAEAARAGVEVDWRLGSSQELDSKTKPPSTGCCTALTAQPSIAVTSLPGCATLERKGGADAESQHRHLINRLIGFGRCQVESAAWRRLSRWDACLKAWACSADFSLTG